MFTRRKFLGGSSCATLASIAFSPGPFVPRLFAGVEAGSIFSRFAALKGSVFQVAKESNATRALKLIQVERTRQVASDSNSPDRNNEKFSLLFSAAPDHALEQNTYTFHNERIGAIPIFIVPLLLPGEDNTRRYYQAIFNCPPDTAFPGAEAHSARLFA